MSDDGHAYVSTCRLCGEAILWVTMVPSMKPAPVNFHPDNDKGNLQLRRGKKDKRKVYARVVDKGSEEGLFLSHFATCPNASEFRFNQHNRGRAEKVSK